MWTESPRWRAQIRPALAGGAILALLGGCASQELAPIEQKSPQVTAAAPPGPRKPSPGPSTDQPPAVYTVVAGDTLYGIAWRFGLDARDIGRWNRLDDVDRIFVGQRLKLRGREPVAPPRAMPGPGVPPTVNAQAPASSPAGALGPRVLPPVTVPGAVAVAKPPPGAPLSGTSPAPVDAAAAAAPPPNSAPSTATAAPTVTESAPPAPPAPAASVPDGSGRAVGGLVWRWPASGKTRPTVAATGAQGVDILGKRGQAVVAAADGQVVYSGSGLRGYGQLIIIKHNDSFLSAYAHNDKLLVSEGSKVKAGQQIAQMGDSEADEVMLHFEIRKGGKAVEPLQFLPSR